MASDFTINEFKNLNNLIIQHGRQSYLRISELINYTLWKGFLLTMPQFFFSFFCSFSANSIFDDWQISLVNKVFTFFPVIFKSILDRDFIASDGSFVQKCLPYTYYIGRENKVFNLKNFLWSTQFGIYQA